MNSIAHELENSNYVSARIKRFFTRYHISDILHKSNAYKVKGFSAIVLLTYLFCLVFRGRSMYMDMTLGGQNFKKDTVYRLLNSVRINWLRFTTLLSARIIAETITPLTSEARRNVFIIDDSICEREHSKCVELLAWVFDHAKRHKSVPGFRMATLGWSDGTTFVPVNCCMMSTENEKSRINPAKEVPAGSCGEQRRTMAQKKMTEVVPELLKNAQKAGIQADYVLFDSWFSSPKEIASIHALNLDVVAMVKRSSRIHYEYEGRMLDCKQIFNACKKRRGRSRYLLSVPITINTENENEQIRIPAKLVYIRNRNNRNEYLVLISTDTSLTEDEIIQLYTRRWDIEVFFKTCKSLLKLTTGCKSLSYDAVCAHTAIVFVRYMFLAVEIREDQDLRTAGPMFCLISNEIPEITVSAALEKLQLFLEKLLQGINASEHEIEAIYSRLKADIPNLIADLLGIKAELSIFLAGKVCEV